MSLPVAPQDFALSESSRYVGRAIASLALDPDRKRWNQQSLSSGELARVHGFTDQARITMIFKLVGPDYPLLLRIQPRQVHADVTN